MSQVSSAHSCVLFDLGGVILNSPFVGIKKYEAEAALPKHSINGVIASTGTAGSFARLERGELLLDDWFSAFEEECAAAGLAVDARRLMSNLGDYLNARSFMLDAVLNLKTHGFKVGAVTNNWKFPGDTFSPWLFTHFDEVIESCVVGAAKPAPDMYLEACRLLDVAPEKCVFLDDIGRNCKAAAALGMTAIKVSDPDDALRELDQVCRSVGRSVGGSFVG